MIDDPDTYPYDSDYHEQMQSRDPIDDYDRMGQNDLKMIVTVLVAITVLLLILYFCTTK